MAKYALAEHCFPAESLPYLISPWPCDACNTFLIANGRGPELLSTPPSLVRFLSMTEL